MRTDIASATSTPIHSIGWMPVRMSVTFSPAPSSIATSERPSTEFPIARAPSARARAATRAGSLYPSATLTRLPTAVVVGALLFVAIGRRRRLRRQRADARPQLCRHRDALRREQLTQL